MRMGVSPPPSSWAPQQLSIPCGSRDLPFGLTLGYGLPSPSLCNQSCGPAHCVSQIVQGGIDPLCSLRCGGQDEDSEGSSRGPTYAI